MMPSLSGTGSKSLLFLAFGLLLSVITALIALGLARVESFNRQVNALSEAQGRKIGTVSELFLANGQRSTLIDKLFAAETPQARQAVLEQYQRAIAGYSGAVKRLVTLQVDATEREARDTAIAARSCPKCCPIRPRQWTICVLCARSAPTNSTTLRRKS